MAHIDSHQKLLEFLGSKSGLRMSHIYKPVMLLTILRNGGIATKQQIAEQFALSDNNQVDYYRRKIVHQMPGFRLVRDGLLIKEGDTYRLSGKISGLSNTQIAEVETVLEKRISDYFRMRNPFGDSNNDAIPGSVRYEVLRKAGARCELCGVSSRDTQIDVDHITPRSKGGSNDPTNLQALCRTCNAQKRDRDNTDFRSMHDSHSHTQDECPFCNIKAGRIIDENRLAYAVLDGFPVTQGHTLIIPKRHALDYFSLTRSEFNAVDQLLHFQRQQLQGNDRKITGFNVGMNCGDAAGQTIFHAHIHLIPRRLGDVDNPRGGVRHTIPGKGYY